MNYAEFLHVIITTIIDDNGIDRSSFRAWCGDHVFQTRSKLYNQEWHGLFSHIKVLYHFSWSGVKEFLGMFHLVHTNTTKKRDVGSQSKHTQNIWISAHKLLRYSYDDLYRNYFVPIITCVVWRVKSIWMRRRIINTMGVHIKVYHYKYKSRPWTLELMLSIVQTKRNKTKKNGFQSHINEQWWNQWKIIGKLNNTPIISNPTL